MRIELYSITHCGFYSRGNSAALFGNTREMLAGLAQWVGSRANVAATATFEDPDSMPDQVLCSAFVGIDGMGAGLALWYKVPSTERGVAYIPMDGKPGKLSASEQKFPRNSVAGWPRYLWIEPENAILAALIPSGPVRVQSAGLPDARKFLLAYLRDHSPFVVRDAPSNTRTVQDSRIRGWRADWSQPPDLALSPKFETRPLLLPGPLDQIREECGNIRKLVTTTTLNRDVPDMRKRVEHLMETFGWDVFRAPGKDTLNFRMETDWTPSEDELEGMIARWKERFAAVKERVGVKLAGQGRILWFDQARCTAEIQMEEPLERALHWSPGQLRRVIRLAKPVVRRLAARAGV